MIGIVNEKFVAMEVEKMEFANPALRGAVEELRNQNFRVIMLHGQVVKTEMYYGNYLPIVGGHRKMAD